MCLSEFKLMQINPGAAAHIRLFFPVLYFHLFVLLSELDYSHSWTCADV